LEPDISGPGVLGSRILRITILYRRILVHDAMAENPPSPLLLAGEIVVHIAEFALRMDVVTAVLGKMPQYLSPAQTYLGVAG
jgi:hypothetical protein